MTALRHVDLCICAGDSVVLMGDNGSGKSTLLKALVGLIHPQQGTYRFDGDLVDDRPCGLLEVRADRQRVHALYIVQSV